MDREAVAQELAANRLADSLEEKSLKEIRAIEALYKTPTDITVNVKVSNAQIETIFGDRKERPLTVVRAPDMDPRYEHDIGLIEGSYDNLESLSKHLESLCDILNHSLHGKGQSYPTADQACALIRAAVDNDEFELPDESLNTELLADDLHLGLFAKTFARAERDKERQCMISREEQRVISDRASGYVETPYPQQYADESQRLDDIQEEAYTSCLERISEILDRAGIEHLRYMTKTEHESMYGNGVVAFMGMDSNYTRVAKIDFSLLDAAVN